jgi:hypothetical protein
MSFRFRNTVKQTRILKAAQYCVWRNCDKTSWSTAAYSGRPRFNSRPEHKLPLLEVSVACLTTYSQMPRQYLKLGHDGFLPQLLNPLFIIHLPLQVTWVRKYPGRLCILLCRLYFSLCMPKLVARWFKCVEDKGHHVGKWRYCTQSNKTIVLNAMYSELFLTHRRTIKASKSIDKYTRNKHKFRFKR